MTLQVQLEKLERQFWTGGRGFYEQHLADDAVMIFPEPVGFLSRDQTIDSLAQSPRWAEVSLDEVHIRRLDAGSAVLLYRATASREGQDTRYETLASSVYHRQDGTWKLLLHQQTPVQ